MRKLSLIILTGALLIGACKKEDKKDDGGNNGGTSTTCLLQNFIDSTDREFRFNYNGNLKNGVDHYEKNLSTGNWGLSDQYAFEYNSNNTLNKFITRSGSYKETVTLNYTAGKVTTAELYDSSSSGPNEYSFTIGYIYNASNKISKWNIFEKSDPNTILFTADFNYDGMGSIKEIILSEEDGTGKIIPSEKYTFTNENFMLADPTLPALLLDFPFFYLVFNQNGMKQFNAIKSYFWDEDLNTWELDYNSDFQNSFDSKGNLTKMVFENEAYHFNWVCK
ncbi:MAG: hypothetical protein FGM41_02695 [Bacteroidetes bacterium]|nr:hypothetical protein [Bacteroidota bacterium]